MSSKLLALKKKQLWIIYQKIVLQLYPICNFLNNTDTPSQVIVSPEQT